MRKIREAGVEKRIAKEEQIRSATGNCTCLITSEKDHLAGSDLLKVTFLFVVTPEQPQNIVDLSLDEKAPD